MSTTNATKRGFTLIELLVVIAIIAILAAILFPVFAKVREKARQTTDLSNIKQAILAVVQYNNDYDEGFPATVTEREAFTGSPRVGFVASTPEQAAPFSIRAILIPYTQSGSSVADANPGIWKDPDTSWVPGDYDSAAGGTKSAGHSGSSSSAFWTTDLGFHLNESQFTASNDEHVWYQAHPDFGFNETTTLASISAPAQFIITADAARANDGTPSRGGLYPIGPEFTAAPNDAQAPTDTTYPVTPLPGNPTSQSGVGPVPNSTYASQSAPSPRHTGGANFGFADGHAKWLHVAQTIKSWQNNYWRRNPVGN